MQSLTNSRESSQIDLLTKIDALKNDIRSDFERSIQKTDANSTKVLESISILSEIRSAQQASERPSNEQDKRHELAIQSLGNSFRLYFE